MKYDITKCTSTSPLKGYTGCMCYYCRSFAIAGKWIVDIKGKANSSSFEISVLRENNRHGIASYGWYDENKLLISSSSHKGVTTSIWNKLIKVAEKEAARLNKLEGFK